MERKQIAEKFLAERTPRSGDVRGPWPCPLACPCHEKTARRAGAFLDSCLRSNETRGPTRLCPGRREAGQPTGWPGVRGQARRARQACPSNTCMINMPLHSAKMLPPLFFWTAACAGIQQSGDLTSVPLHLPPAAVLGFGAAGLYRQGERRGSPLSPPRERGVGHLHLAKMLLLFLG
jgi:hypothetical protein